MREPKIVRSVACSFALLTALAHTANATVLFTDNFTVLPGGVNNQDVNQNLGSNSRVGGTLAPGIITSGSGYLLGVDHHQVGNIETDVGQPSVTDGNYVLVAFGGSFQSTIDIASAAAGPVIISFDMYASSTSNAGGDSTNWGSFTLRGADGGNGFPIAGAGEFGMLRRTNGGIQVFQDGSSGVTPAGYDQIGFTDTNSPHWQWTFTDTAGTGSAFNGNGSVANWVNGANSGSITLSQLNSSDLYLGWSNAADRFIGIDNLSIETVPEPSAAVISIIGLVGMALVRRRS